MALLSDKASFAVLGVLSLGVLYAAHKGLKLLQPLKPVADKIGQGIDTIKANWDLHLGDSIQASGAGIVMLKKHFDPDWQLMDSWEIAWAKMHPDNQGLINRVMSVGGYLLPQYRDAISQGRSLVVLPDEIRIED
ncbi:hypothetical protein [Bowmanella yangjiangensis]|uniref:Uncharacterized protein n=1 Tax=Bowmanella yangjiangensis TaxID=2811230 RepID=A0ABS3CTT6_9ALTE|nr:hypothetical protein [Bowmanella yangjiangensis]MBN7820532.1 hypothetical protein [Bowmanella yangjiangensis]